MLLFEGDIYIKTHDRVALVIFHLVISQINLHYIHAWMHTIPKDLSQEIMVTKVMVVSVPGSEMQFNTHKNKE